MSHYWTADDPSESRRAQVLDWIEDLIEFGADVVVDACRDWRRTQTRRPTPADIRRLCIERHRQQVERKQLAAPSDMDEYARSVGFANNAQRMEAIRRDKERRRPQQDAQAIKDQWARERGYTDCADYQEQLGLDDVDACCNIACSFLATALDKGKRAFNEPPERDRHALLDELGVTAKPEKVWTAEEMRAGRIALGLEREPEPEPEEDREWATEEVAK